QDGNVVALTYTLNGSFGSAVVAPGTGFLLNNEMDDFAVKPGAPNLYGLVQGEANAIAPGKRPLSSMSPTIVEQDGRPVLVLGSPGGSRIITTVLETLTNIVDFGLSPAAAARRGRGHHLPDRRRPRSGPARGGDRGDGRGAAQPPHRLCPDPRLPGAARGDRGAGRAAHRPALHRRQHRGRAGDAGWGVL